MFLITIDLVPLFITRCLAVVWVLRRSPPSMVICVVSCAYFVLRLFSFIGVVGGESVSCSFSITWINSCSTAGSCCSASIEYLLVVRIGCGVSCVLEFPG